jgi:hypothetical protein
MSDDEFIARIVYWLNTITNTKVMNPSCLIIGTHKDAISEERLQMISEKVEKLESQFRFIIGFFYFYFIFFLYFYFPFFFLGFITMNMKDDPMDNVIKNLFQLSNKASLGTKKVPLLNYNLEKILNYHQKLLKERESIIGGEKIEKLTASSLNDEEFKEILSLQNVRKFSTFISHKTTDIESHLNFLHDMGSLLYYEDELLKDIVILDLGWLASRMADLISFKNK